MIYWFAKQTDPAPFIIFWYNFYDLPVCIFLKLNKRLLTFFNCTNSDRKIITHLTYYLYVDSQGLFIKTPIDFFFLCRTFKTVCQLPAVKSLYTPHQFESDKPPSLFASAYIHGLQMRATIGISRLSHSRRYISTKHAKGKGSSIWTQRVNRTLLSDGTKLNSQGFGNKVPDMLGQKYRSVPNHRPFLRDCWIFNLDSYNFVMRKIGTQVSLDSFLCSVHSIRSL